MAVGEDLLNSPRVEAENKKKLQQVVSYKDGYKTR